MHTFFRFVRFRFLQLPLQLAVYHSRHYLPKNITVIFQALLYHTQDIVIPLKTSDIMPRHYDTSLDLIYYSSHYYTTPDINIPFQTFSASDVDLSHPSRTAAKWSPGRGNALQGRPCFDVNCVIFFVRRVCYVLVTTSQVVSARHRAVSLRRHGPSSFFP